MNRSKLKNRYTKGPSRENFLAFKKPKNIFKNLSKKTKKNYFSKIKSKSKSNFLTSKGFLYNEDVALHIGDKTVTDCNELAKEFKNIIQIHYEIQLEKQPWNCKVPIMLNPL